MHVASNVSWPKEAVLEKRMRLHDTTTFDVSIWNEGFPFKSFCRIN